ncbi:MAG: hypothetical protein QM763_01355 [Agriterribacter sp.]
MRMGMPAKNDVSNHAGKRVKMYGNASPHTGAFAGAGMYDFR